MWHALAAAGQMLPDARQPAVRGAHLHAVVGRLLMQPVHTKQPHIWVVEPDAQSRQSLRQSGGAPSDAGVKGLQGFQLALLLGCRCAEFISDLMHRSGGFNSPL